MIKLVAPKMACNVIDRAIQMHGGMGVCQDVVRCAFRNQPYFYSVFSCEPHITCINNVPKPADISCIFAYVEPKILPRLWIGARTLRLADGPDEVHADTIAKLELRGAKL